MTKIAKKKYGEEKSKMTKIEEFVTWMWTGELRMPGTRGRNVNIVLGITSSLPQRIVSTKQKNRKSGIILLGWFLFSKISETPFVHVPKLFPLLHWSQNTFCFLCSSTPSHGDRFFRLQWECQWENDQNKKKGQKSLFRGPKWFPKCLNEGFRGDICIEKWS